MSHIQVDLKVIEVLAPSLASATGRQLRDIVGGLNLLWHRCWSTKNATVTRTGLAGAFGADGLDALLPCLIEEGFLTPEGAGWHVCGATKYLRIREARARGGRAAASNLRRGIEPGINSTAAGAHVEHMSEASRHVPGEVPGSFPALTPNTEHRTPNTKEEAPPAPPEAVAVVFQCPKKPPIEWLGEDFFAWAQFKRQEIGFIGERRRPRNLSAWFSVAMQAVGGDVEVLQEAFYAFGGSKHWQASTPPLPFAAFVTQWDQFIPRGAVQNVQP